MILRGQELMKKQTEGSWDWIEKYFPCIFPPETNTNMKKLFFFFLSLFLLAACGGGGSKDNKASSGNDITKNPDYQKGLELVAKDNCFTCHKIDEPHTGPSYRDVANKYAGRPDTIITYLAHKIIKGGTGNWGAIFMTNHPNLSEADAEAMVKYILLLKK